MPYNAVLGTQGLTDCLWMGLMIIYCDLLGKVIIYKSSPVCGRFTFLMVRQLKTVNATIGMIILNTKVGIRMRIKFNLELQPRSLLLTNQNTGRLIKMENIPITPMAWNTFFLESSFWWQITLYSSHDKRTVINMPQVHII